MSGRLSTAPCDNLSRRSLPPLLGGGFAGSLAAMPVRPVEGGRGGWGLGRGRALAEGGLAVDATGLRQGELGVIGSN